MSASKAAVCNKSCRAVLVSLLLLTSNLGYASSTFRCGSQLVSAGDSSYEVLHRCGDPVDRSFTGNKVVRDRYGYSQEVPVEEWTYGPNHGMYHRLRFEGGRLQNVDSYRGP